MLKMGCAKVDVTPDFSVFLHGYGARTHDTKSVENPIEVGVIALEQAGKKVLMITADMIGINCFWCRKIQAELTTEFGLYEPDIWISGSHTHFAPGFWGFPVVGGNDAEIGLHPNDGRYYTLWMNALKQAVRTAFSALRPVSVECADMPVPGIAFNRRTVRKDNGKVDTNYIYPHDHASDYHFSPIDDRLSVWRFMADGRPQAVLARYSCHPVTGGEDMYGISGDYPGYFKRAVERILGCPGFFLLGTAGDVVPMRRAGTSREDLGEVLARTIKLNDLKFQPADDFSLATAVFTVKSHIARLDGYDRKERESRWQREVRQARPDTYNEALVNEAYKYEISARYPETNDPEIPIHLLRLGDRVLVGLPFEVLTQIGLRLSAACPSALIATITGGYEGYLPLAEDFPKGGYESDRGAEFAQDTGDRILEACIAEVRKFAK